MSKFEIGQKVVLQKLRSRSKFYTGKIAVIVDIRGDDEFVVETIDAFTDAEIWQAEFGTKPPSWMLKDDAPTKWKALCSAKQMKAV